LIGISTSGNSPNLVRAFKSAARLGVLTVALLGKDGGKMKDLADHVLLIPSHSTPRIQEAHQWTWHTWCDLIDQLGP
jgi:D-sedoheptulose 7-phosphate isomerase